jgi:hypothetical protein
MDEVMPPVVLQIRQVFPAARIGQRVKIDDLNIRPRAQNVSNKIRANETCTTGDKYSLHRSCPSLPWRIASD